MWLTGDLCLCKNLANYQSLLVLAHLLWWQAWGQLSMVVSWPGDSSASLLREVIWWQFRSVFSIAWRCLQVAQDSKKHLPLVMVVGWVVESSCMEWSINWSLNFLEKIGIVMASCVVELYLGPCEFHWCTCSSSSSSIFIQQTWHLLQ